MFSCLLDGNFKTLPRFTRCSPDIYNYFKTMSDSNRLICPYCKQFLIFRYSDNFTPHFAHRFIVDTDCPYSFPSDEEVPSNLFDSESSCSSCGYTSYLNTDIGKVCHSCYSLNTF